MSKIDGARTFLQDIGMPKAQQGDLCCYSLLAMAGITADTEWADASNNWIRIHDIMQFISQNYGVTYAENSRETFRKQAMHHFRNAALIEDNGKATNSPNYMYRITEETLELIKCIGTSEWDEKLAEFKENHKSLVEIYASKKVMKKMPVKINGEDFIFSPGKHIAT